MYGSHVIGELVNNFSVFLSEIDCNQMNEDQGYDFSLFSLLVNLESKKWKQEQ